MLFKFSSHYCLIPRFYFLLQLLRESIAEHKPHIDKLLKIGPQLAELSVQEGATVTQRYTEAERRYLAIKEEVKGRAAALDEAVSQSAQVRHAGQSDAARFSGSVTNTDLGLMSFIIVCWGTRELNYILCIN